MSQNFPSIINSLGSVISGAGALWSAGAAVANTGVGVTTLTLDKPCDESQCAVMITRRGAAAAADGTFGVAHTSDSVKTVTYTVAGAAADVAFDFLVLQAPLS